MRLLCNYRASLESDFCPEALAEAILKEFSTAVKSSDCLCGLVSDSYPFYAAVTEEIRPGFSIPEISSRMVREILEGLFAKFGKLFCFVEPEPLKHANTIIGIDDDVAARVAWSWDPVHQKNVIRLSVAMANGVW